MLCNVQLCRNRLDVHVSPRPVGVEEIQEHGPYLPSLNEHSFARALPAVEFIDHGSFNM